jgi:hypothetical protein
LLSVSILEDMGFAVTFQKGKVLIYLEGLIPQTKVNIVVSEGTEKVIQVAKPSCKRIQGDLGSWIKFSERE